MGSVKGFVKARILPNSSIDTVKLDTHERMALRESLVCSRCSPEPHNAFSLFCVLCLKQVLGPIIVFLSY